MDRAATLLVCSTLVSFCCSTRPTLPTSSPALAPSGANEGEGTSAGAAVTVERIRLQRVDGPDIVTSLVTGQLIDVPLNADLRIWAEIRRLETEFVRLVVDWGDGTSDFFPCGACRVDYKYTREGRYQVTAKLVDQNAPRDSPPIFSVTVTLNVVDLPPAPTPKPVGCLGLGPTSNGFRTVIGSSPERNGETPGPRSSFTIGFNGLPAVFPPPRFPSPYSESGFTVSAPSGCWEVFSGYGNPAPFIVFSSSNATADQITVSAGGSSFSFTSVDLYSSVTAVPYVFTGYLNGNPVFTAPGRVANAFGAFQKVTNPFSSATIDTLVIALANNPPPCCPNPMGLDNIVLNR